MAKFEKGNKYAAGLTNSGRPPKFKNKEELISRIKEYFDNSVKEKFRPTITGLALYLGFSSRQSIYDYAKNTEYSYSIKRAILVIENEYEILLTGNNVSGVIFALKNMDWTDKQELDVKNKVIRKLVVEFVEGKKKRKSRRK